MSPRVLRTTRALPKETLTYEAPDGLDGQGKPSYDSPVAFSANVVLFDVVSEGVNGAGEVFVTMPDGSKVKAPLTLYIEGDALAVPEEASRITRGQEHYIVVERLPVSGLFESASEPDHYRLRCRLA